MMVDSLNVLTTADLVSKKTEQEQLPKEERKKQLLLQLHQEGLIYFDIDRGDWVTLEELLNSTDIYSKIQRLQDYLYQLEHPAQNQNVEQTDTENTEEDLFGGWVDDMIAEPSGFNLEQPPVNTHSDFYPGWINNTLPKTLEILKKNRPIPALPDAPPDFQQACLTAMDFDYNTFDQKTRDYLAQNILQCQIGMNWIDPEIYTQFACEFFDIKIKVFYSIKRYFIEAGNIFSEKNRKKYGTDKFYGHEIFLKLLNKEQLQVTTKDKKTGKNVLDSEKTVDLQTKAREIQRAFSEWVWQDLDRTIKLTQTYNRIFNCIHVSYINGEHLEFPGLNPECQLKKEQKDAVWRIIKSQATGLFARVGFGKTWVMVCAAMLLKQMKLAKRPTIIVLNSTLSQVVATARHLYPKAKILYRNEEDFDQPKTAQRAILAHQITTQDWDLIILTHEQFLAIPISPATQEELAQAQLTKLNKLIEEYRGNHRYSSDYKNAIRYLERQHNKLQKSIQQVYATYSSNSGLFPCWESLDIDALFVDESQQFKNLWFQTNMGNIAGLANNNSQRSLNLYYKILHLHKQNHRIIFSTGTPLSNSIAEMFTLMRYLCPRILKQMNLEEFDDWASQFGEIVEQPEVDVTGRYRMKTRFLQFKNLPELMAIFHTFAIVYTDQNIESFDGKPIPYYATVSIPQTAQQQDYMKELADRASAIHCVDPKIDNLAKICQEARLCSLDTGLLGNPDPDLRSKLHTLIQNIYLAWRVLKPYRGVQVVFCDLVRYAYDYIIQSLMHLGIPFYEIQAVQNAKNREELYQMAQKGSVSIVLASTDTAGTGVNIQNRLAVLHHANAPWRPSDVIQREGRIVRQGNSFKSVLILRYVNQSQTQQLSYDTFMWQTLENKAKFCEQVLNTNLGFIPRTIEDIYTQKTLSYAEIKAIASGNPIFLEKTQLEHRLKQIQIEYSNWRRNQMALRHDKARAEAEIPFCQKRLEQLEHIDLDRPTGQLLSISFNSWEQFAQILTEKSSIFESESSGNLWSLIPIATRLEWKKDDTNKITCKTQFLINKTCIRCRKPDSLRKEIEALILEYKKSLAKRIHDNQEILTFATETVFPKKAEMIEIQNRLAEIEEEINKEALEISSHNLIIDNEPESDNSDDDPDNSNDNSNNDKNGDPKNEELHTRVKVSWKLCRQLQTEAEQILSALAEDTPDIPEKYLWLIKLKQAAHTSFPNISDKILNNTNNTDNTDNTIDVVYEVEADGQLSLFSDF